MIKTARVLALTGSKNGLALLEWDLPGGSGEVGLNTGLILAPTAASWSVFPWKLESTEACQNYQLNTKVFTGFVAFSDIVGTPDARFGTGVGDPGYSANQQGNYLQGVSYSLSNLAVDLAQLNGASRPIEILSTGEIVMYYNNPTGNAAYVKAVLTIGEEVILPFPPFLVP